MKNILVDSWCRSHHTLGIIYLNDKTWFSLELPWENNEPNVSCIPAGTYPAFFRISPSRGTRVLQLSDVPGRSYIQWHPGNYTHQIKGCLLPGKGMKFLDNDNIPDVTGSRQALQEIFEEIGDDDDIRITYNRIGQ